MSATSPTPVVPPLFEQKKPSSGLLLLVAALLSALLPGTGHLSMKRWRKGVLILLAYIAIFTACFWMRLPQTIPGIVLTVLAFLGFCMLAATDAVYGGHRPESKPTQWWLAALLPAALLAGSAHARLAVRAAGLWAFASATTSMAPALPQGSYLLVDNRYYRHKDPQRGDVIVFDAPTSPGLLLFKRVIAIGGDTIKIEGDRVYLNGTLLSEPYARFEGHANALLWSVPPDALPAGKLFVMGDNRNLSFDSRYPKFGLIDISTVRGKVIYALPSLSSEIKKF